MNTGKNRYYKFSKISEARFRRLLRAFAMDLTASDAARLTGISLRSVNAIYLKIRRRVAAYCEEQSPYSGEVELDESYFGPRRIRGKRGRGAGGKTIVFGVFKRNGHVYTEIVPDAKKKTLLQVVRGRVTLDSVVHTDGWRAYDGLVDLGYEKHYRVQHADNEFVGQGSNHINGIESFWAYAKLRLSRFKGLPKHTFYLHLKETEFRFNNRREDIYKRLLKLLRERPIE
ncbi:IS1595 family transposase [Alcanivorax sp.]|uniref:IS1595 family transposase n=1 Tax=Alcanivorax sp. TaxID=1872427 RepID=UPI000C0F5715|nr:IS1595 family transposase [Alcanivorax sp.]PHR68114.1 MAG: IS1595 family transposase [Alcanivorax sp.]